MQFLLLLSHNWKVAAGSYLVALSAALKNHFWYCFHFVTFIRFVP